MSLKPLRQLLGLDSTFKHINEVAKSPTLTRLPMIDGEDKYAHNNKRGSLLRVHRSYSILKKQN